MSSESQIQTNSHELSEKNTKETFKLVELGGLSETQEYLEKTGFFSEGNILIVDLDETLRPTLDGGLRLRFGEIPQESQDFLKKALGDGVKVAIVTNQPRKGHQLSKAVAAIKGYDASFDFFENMKIPVYGYDAAGLNPLEAVKYITSLVNQDLYKSTDAGIEEVGSWVNEQMGERVGIKIACIGNSDRDIKFGYRLYKKIKEQAQTCEDFITIRLPNFASKSARFLNEV